MSPKYSLNLADAKKIGKGLLIAVGGAVLTYLAQAITQVNFGVYTPLVMALASVAVNAGQKFLSGENVD